MKTRRARSGTAAVPPPASWARTRREYLRGVSRGMTEEAIHREVVKHIEARRRPGVVWWHTPNGDARHPGVAGRLKAMGTRPGIPDLLLLRAGQLYGLELKRLGGRTSAHQEDRQRELAAAGAIIATVQGLDGALHVLEQWGLIHACR